MARPQDTVLKLVGLQKSFRQTVAVADLSLDVRRGELVCLLGPSGCGKTTTLRMIAGFVAPDAGDIVIAGATVNRVPPHRRDTGMVFQSYALFPHLSVAENIAFGLRNLKLAAGEREARVEAMLAMVELEALAARLPRELSGGQQQRVALARALAVQPAVLLLDEPLSNLDAQLRGRMGEEIRGLIRRLEMTTIFVTHDQEEALALADRIVVMNHGRAEQIAAPATLYEAPESRFVAQFIGLCNLLDGTIVAQTAEGWRVRTAAGLELVAAGGAAGAGVGTAVAVAIRPEHVVLAGAGAAANRFSARVASTTYLGSLSRHRLKVAGHDLIMERHMTGAERLSDGSEIGIAWDPAHARLLPDGSARGGL